MQAAEAAVEAARLDLEFTQVRAPLAGRTGQTLVDAIQFTDEGAGATSSLPSRITAAQQGLRF
ncbi:hypothetical protein AKJ09_10299 [Labilithrix luteola]|uniref:Uncharacterized protein n=1 Tax=Labilithrix luteola TaxID=1391654 RepID=A0A0K1QCX4_9BACT|nr:hypothetical protein AKJ09_10299 [Labilithrix luteola]